MSTTTLPIAEIPSTRLILTQVADITLAFPTTWVTEIFQAERTRVLSLPFYDARMLGILHHNGQVIPLVVGARLFGSTSSNLKETLLVIQLSHVAGPLAGVGIVVDQLLGSNQGLERAAQDSGMSKDGDPTARQRKPIVFDADLILDTLWTPQRWAMTP